jgi:GNAT superfamily N-acetyltransferase
MQIQPLDPADAAALEAILDVWAAAHAVDDPEDPPFCRQWERGGLTNPRPDEAVELWGGVAGGVEGGTVRGVLQLQLPTLENLDTAFVELCVHPEHRRRGLGSALARHAAARMGAVGRERAVFTTKLDDAGAAFARKLAAQPSLVDARRRFEIGDDTRDLVDRLLTTAAARASGYSLVRWRDRVPEEYVDGIAYLHGRMSTDAPMDDLAWDPQAYDRNRLRAREGIEEVKGRRSYGVAAIHDATGQLAGFTELGFDPCQAVHGWQEDTIVDPVHRGHRLGTLVKCENLRFVLDHEPQLRSVTTWNAASNRHMIAINEAMGFRLVDLWQTWQLWPARRPDTSGTRNRDAAAASGRVASPSLP